MINYKKEFPFFKHNPNLIYLDSAASSLKLGRVINKISNYYETNGTNVHRGVYSLSHQATSDYEETRNLVAKLINSNPEEIIFTKGTTDSLNSLSLSLMHLVNEGDEIITSELEHHSSLIPWQIVASKKNATLKYVPLNEEGKITLNGFLEVFNEKTRIVALTHVSNVLGHLTPVKAIIKAVRKINKDVIFILDAAQSIGHIKVDVKDLDVDFLAFSAHKMYGPSGVGILYGKKRLLEIIPPFEYGGEMAENVNKDVSTFKELPFKFEAGTPNVAGVIGLGEAIKFLLDNVHLFNEHEMKLKDYALSKLKDNNDITIYNKNSDSGIITFNVNNVHPHDIASVLDQKNIAIRAGHHCAQLINKKLKQIATLRASFAIYNTLKDIDTFITALEETINFFKEFGI